MRNLFRFRGQAVGSLILVVMMVTATVFLFAAIMGVIIFWLPLVLLAPVAALKVGPTIIHLRRRPQIDASLHW